MVQLRSGALCMRAGACLCARLHASRCGVQAGAASSGTIGAGDTARQAGAHARGGSCHCLCACAERDAAVSGAGAQHCLVYGGCIVHALSCISCLC